MKHWYGAWNAYKYYRRQAQRQRTRNARHYSGTSVGRKPTAGDKADVLFIIFLIFLFVIILPTVITFGPDMGYGWSALLGIGICCVIITVGFLLLRNLSISTTFGQLREKIGIGEEVIRLNRVKYLGGIRWHPWEGNVRISLCRRGIVMFTGEKASAVRSSAISAPIVHGNGVKVPITIDNEPSVMTLEFRDKEQIEKYIVWYLEEVGDSSPPKRY